MTISQTAEQTRAGVLAHLEAVGLSDSRCETQNGHVSSPSCNMPRRMVAVTVALSEPLDCVELDWADTIAANLRLIYRDTTVEIIDTWRTA